jgi:hypothetical protein
MNASIVGTPSSYLSFPKITSGRIDGAIRPRSEWLQWRQTVGRLDLTAHLSVIPSAYAVCTENLNADVMVMKSAKYRA